MFTPFSVEAASHHTASSSFMPFHGYLISMNRTANFTNY